MAVIAKNLHHSVNVTLSSKRQPEPSHANRVSNLTMVEDDVNVARLEEHVKSASLAPFLQHDFSEQHKFTFDLKKGLKNGFI
ncbi:hypothetical protein [Deinococcus cellulosilyticus]|uniref:hypothetical protein n=1 Tax=Deinococcus cellulosilyticus TaxID=401558 RepID=UPI0011BF13CF|nr:hypothetical protein [Deinococcus cellulosilyticus]